MEKTTEWERFFAEFRAQKTGKTVGTTYYLHKSLLKAKGFGVPEFQESGDKISNFDWNCLKVDSKTETVSFLNYLDFETSDHPILQEALTFHPSTGKSKRIKYDLAHNPPILHRKELLVPPDYPDREKWVAQTEKEEALGLYEDPKTIGFLENWKSLVEGKKETPSQVDRHRTAISRYTLSKPVQVLLQEGILTKEKSFFDYGCGKGDDMAGLTQMGFTASGWDPVHRPETEKKQADVVNLGFVLNVIEDPAERIEVLHRAFDLTNSVLCVSVLVENMQTASIMKPYKDGFLTSRNTFQKFYNQAECAQLLEDVLGSPISAQGPGIFLVFKKPEEAEDYLYNKASRKAAWTTFGLIPIWSRDQKKKFQKDKFFSDHAELIENYWNTTLELGRFPSEEEFEALSKLKEKSGSVRKLQTWIVEHFGKEAFEKALEQKRADLIVYLALRHFHKKLPLNQLPKNVQNDIKACFSGFQQAWDTSRSYLFQIGKPAVITEKCNGTKLGRLDAQALYVKPMEVASLDPILRIYVETGGLFYGNIFDCHEIKIHKESGKVTFLQYEDPLQVPPKTTIRVKVDLGRQKVEYFDHGLA